MPFTTEPSASVADALESRISARAFLNKPVPRELLDELFNRARRAPSGGNLQPWNVHVLTGEKLKKFVADGLSRNPVEDGADVTIAHYPSPLWEPKRTWRWEVGERMYALMGIARDDKEGRLLAMMRNVEFFGAPVGIIITADTRYDIPQYLDIGIYLQTLMLLARQLGLHTAPQGWWRQYPKLARDHLDYPETEYPVVGMSLGFADPDAPVNALYTDRAEMGDLVHFYED